MGLTSSANGRVFTDVALKWTDNSVDEKYRVRGLRFFDERSDDNNYGTACQCNRCSGTSLRRHDVDAQSQSGWSGSGLRLE